MTVSTNVLVSGKIKFDLYKRHLDAANKLTLGSRDHVAVELTGNPLGLRADEIVFEKSESRQTAAIFANAYGSTVCIIDVAGNFGRELAAKGQAAMVDFAVAWLAGLYGTDIRSSIRRQHATRWNHEPWVLGAASVAAPGGQSARKVMMEPVRDRIFFAGEAVHETLWGTLGGAWESGERARMLRSGSSVGGADPESSHARKTAPVRLPTSATILPASASISWSVIVFSRGCSVTDMAIDFLPGSMPAPS